jgi:hypothetical protein
MLNPFVVVARQVIARISAGPPRRERFLIGPTFVRRVLAGPSREDGELIVPESAMAAADETQNVLRLTPLP